jgi:hypothetical protein
MSPQRVSISCRAAALWPRQAGTDSGFFPFARLSAQTIDAVIAAGQNGIDGFYEVVWPTVLHHRDLVIEDIGGDGQFVRPGNVNRWYTSTLTSQNLSPGTFVARPIRFRPGLKRNKLWHPVKRRSVRYVLRSADIANVAEPRGTSGYRRSGLHCRLLKLELLNSDYSPSQRQLKRGRGNPNLVG